MLRFTTLIGVLLFASLAFAGTDYKAIYVSHKQFIEDGIQAALKLKFPKRPKFNRIDLAQCESWYTKLKDASQNPWGYLGFAEHDMCDKEYFFKDDFNPRGMQLYHVEIAFFSGTSQSGRSFDYVFRFDYSSLALYAYVDSTSGQIVELLRNYGLTENTYRRIYHLDSVASNGNFIAHMRFPNNPLGTVLDIEWVRSTDQLLNLYRTGDGKGKRNAVVLIEGTEETNIEFAQKSEGLDEKCFAAVSTKDRKFEEFYPNENAVKKCNWLR